LRREREGDQEVGCLHELLQLALDPLSRGCSAALWASLVIARVPGEVDLAAIRAGQSPPAHRRSSAVGDGPEGATLIGRERWLGGQELRQESTQRPQNGVVEGHERSVRQVAAEFVHQAQSFAGGLMGEVQIHHGGGDVLMAEQLLDRVQMGPGFQQVRREAMTKRMN
jgi:hypothetical protein